MRLLVLVVAALTGEQMPTATHVWSLSHHLSNSPPFANPGGINSNQD